MSIASMPTIAPTEQATVLHGVTWDDYVRFRDDPENDGSRMTYSDGVLEIMTLSLSFFHESISLLIHDFVTAWKIHHNIDIAP